MKPLASPPHVSSSRRRFVTFGGALILAACLTLVKLTLVAFEVTEQDIFPGLDAVGQRRTVEQISVRREPAADEAGLAWPESLPEPAAGPAGQDDGSQPLFGDPASPGDTPAMGGPAPALDPSALTEGQIQALQQLTARRQELDERERLLDMRAELNGRTEARLDDQIRQLAALKEQIEGLVVDLDEDEEQKLARLVKIYETMKPKAAAEIFNRLEIPVLLHVVERMKEAKSAVVLGRMNPAIAERVTTELARRKERPSLSGQGLGG
jgi:flagellar motility protein MotE (MotC chaperone)